MSKRDYFNKRKCANNIKRCTLDFDWGVYEMEDSINDLKDFLTERDLNDDNLLDQIDYVERTLANFKSILEELQKACTDLNDIIRESWTCERKDN